MTTSNANITGQQQNLKGDAHQKACSELQFFAQPYNPDAAGFYFATKEEFQTKTEGLTDRFGCPVEEFEIQLIDGSSEESDLFQACSVNQANIGQFLAIVDVALDYQLPAIFYLCDVLGYSMADAMDRLDVVTIYNGELKDAAEELFDECYASQIPENLRNYIDYDAFAHDCEIGGDMTEFEFAGETFTCTNAACL